MEFVDVRKFPEFDNHKLIALVYDKNSGLEGFIAIHRGSLKLPSFGATRLWNYPTRVDALRDALRLSRTMSYKAAMAGLSCGGAKGVVLVNAAVSKNRKKLLKSYAEKVNYLGGRFVTGADVGVSREDVKLMRRASPHFVGVKAGPVDSTAFGLLCSIKTCLKEIYGSESLKQRIFAIQGMGKVGAELLRLLYPKSKKIFVADIDKAKIRFIKKKFPKIQIVSPRDIHKRVVDVFSPCALSGCLNNKSILQLRCKIIVGGANNQLESPQIAKLLHKVGILYAPDYVVNAGGLISVYDEYENKDYKARRVKKKVEKIGSTLEKVINESKKKMKTPLSVADKMAENIFNTSV